MDKRIRRDESIMTLVQRLHAAMGIKDSDTVISGWRAQHYQPLLDLLSAAVYEERERCAKVAEAHPDRPVRPATVEAMGAKGKRLQFQVANQIARAIRDQVGIP